MNKDLTSQDTKNNSLPSLTKSELNTTGAIFAFVSGIFIAFLQHLKNLDIFVGYTQSIDYLIPISPAVSTLITAIIINIHRKKSYKAYRFKEFDDVHEKYNRLVKEINNQIKNWEKKSKLAQSNEERRNFVNARLTELEKNKIKLEEEKLLELKNIKLPSPKPPDDLFPNGSDKEKK